MTRLDRLSPAYEAHRSQVLKRIQVLLMGFLALTLLWCAYAIVRFDDLVATVPFDERANAPHIRDWLIVVVFLDLVVLALSTAVLAKVKHYYAPYIAIVICVFAICASVTARISEANLWV